MVKLEDLEEMDATKADFPGDSPKKIPTMSDSPSPAHLQEVETTLNKMQGKDARKTNPKEVKVDSRIRGRAGKSQWRIFNFPLGIVGKILENTLLYV
jgi:hypothetical protein